VSDDDRRDPHVHDAIDCRRLVDLLGEYVDDQLPAEQKTAVEQHVGQCAPCVAFLRQYRFAASATRDHLLSRVPVELENRLLSFLRERTRR
jgi:anti-sigma factor RsiW